MSKAKTETKMDSFQSWAHRWGRVGTLIALIYMVALPFVVLAAYDSIPSLGEVFNVNTFSILLIYILLGCVMDSLAMILLTIPIFYPVVMGLDFFGMPVADKSIWFGILVLMTVGIGLIAPPVGIADSPVE